MLHRADTDPRPTGRVPGRRDPRGYGDRVHVFDDFRAPDPAAVVSLVREHPFAVVVGLAAQDGTAGGSAPGDLVPAATHVPVVPAPGSDLSHGLEGAVLWGHMARANPQWRTFVPGPRVLAIFSGPHGYVSPTTYETSPAAPTWNYSAVHVVGRVRVVEDPQESLAVVVATVEALEGSQASPWSHQGSLGYFRKILPGVTAFTISVESVTAVFKMSQDKPDEVYDRVRAGFAARGGAVSAVLEASNAVRGCPARGPAG